LNFPISSNSNSQNLLYNMTFLTFILHV
jgi:hypothetical protein